MNKTDIINAVPQKDEDYEIALNRAMIESEYNRSDMVASQKRIERLRAETSDILAETRQVLAKLAA